MNEYMVSVFMGDGKHGSVRARTRARTSDGVLRAIGRAVADQLGTDVFVCEGSRLMRRCGERWKPERRLSKADDNLVWRAAHAVIAG